jgi:23S rRNA pseudouridine1911/1915/1917 synthase
VLKQLGLEFALVECRLETGRTHQIRVHMASIDCPVLGDPLYAGRHPRQLKRLSQDVQDAVGQLTGQMLHAGEIKFIHPVTHETIHLMAETPIIFQNTLIALSKR